MKGTLYGLGVGPGDPELMTLKAIRILSEQEYIAVPSNTPSESVAYRIALTAYPDLEKKNLLALPMPMSHNKETLKKSHEAAAEKIEQILDSGYSVVFLTLGDPSIYSTFGYVQKIVTSHGYPTEYISGIPSFCAVAAKMNLPLSLWSEEIHIIPGIHTINVLPQTGTCIIMKSGKNLPLVKKMLKTTGRDAFMVENCGMENEQIYEHLDNLPDSSGYFSLIISPSPS